MSRQEWDNLGHDAEPKDRTKWMWLGVLVLLGAAILALYIANQKSRDITQVRGRHILIRCNKNDPVDRSRALELITDLRKRIESGERFARLAKEYSGDDYSAARGGDLGYYPRGSFEGAFEQYVWEAPLGALSDVIETTHGFHLIIVDDRHVSKADVYETGLEQKARKDQAAPPAAAAPPNK